MCTTPRRGPIFPSCSTVYWTNGPLRALLQPQNVDLCIVLRTRATAGVQRQSNVVVSGVLLLHSPLSGHTGWFALLGYCIIKTLLIRSLRRILDTNGYLSIESIFRVCVNRSLFKMRAVLFSKIQSKAISLKVNFQRISLLLSFSPHVIASNFLCISSAFNWDIYSQPKNYI